MADLGGGRTGRFGMFPQRAGHGRSRRPAYPLAGAPAAGVPRVAPVGADLVPVVSPRVTVPGAALVRVRRPFAAAAVISVGLVLVLVLGASPATGVASPPDVAGRTLSAARELLAAAGIAHVVTVPARPVAADGDTVVIGEETVPLLRGVEAEVRVRARVPSAVGLTVAEATERMASVGLVACPDDDAGTVVAQAAPVGSVLPFGAAVGLTVASDGGVRHPPVIPVVVPSLLGMSPDAAAAVLTEAGLVVEHRLRGAGDAGPVQDQEPAAGTRVGPGSLVTLVAQGERLAPGFSSVPDVLGLQVDAAERLLAEVGLTLGVAARPPDLQFDALGPILEQEPAPGTEVEAGSTVTAVVDGLVAVPDLVGLDLVDAARLLSSVGLTLVRGEPAGGPPDGSSGARENEPAVGADGERAPRVASAVAVLPVSTAQGEPRERVTGQTPAPGTLVPAGSAIVVTLAPVEGPAGGVPTAPPGPWPWWWLVVVLAVLVTLSVLLLLRGVRHGRWVAAHVTASPHPTPAAVTVRAPPGSPPSLRVRVVRVPGPLDDVQVRKADSW